MEILALQNFAEALNRGNFNMYVSNVKSTMNDVFNILTKNCKTKFHRYSLVGGLEKRTSTPLKADADIVMFYNDNGQSRRSILEDIQDVLLLNTRMEEKDFEITTNDTIKFVRNGIPFDLLVAENFVSPNSTNVIDEQRRKSMLKLKQAGDYKKSFGEFGVQVTESSVQFMKEKNKLVHDIAKLAKYWNQMMLFKEYIYGRSTIMELLAVKAGQEERNNASDPSLTNAFKRFLEKVSRIKETNIVFTDYYSKGEIPPEIIKQSPLLMDPVNPYNNLLGGECGYGYRIFNFKSTALKEFMSFMENAAEMTLKLLNNGCSDLRMVFYPQPLLFELAKKEKWLFPKKSSYLIQICKNSDPDIQSSNDNLTHTMPEYILRNPKANNMKRDIDAMLKAYAGAVCNLTKSKPDLSTYELKEEMQGFIDEMKGEKTNWVTVYEKHNDKDVTMIIPIDGDQNVCISFDIDSNVISDLGKLSL